MAAPINKTSIVIIDERPRRHKRAHVRIPHTVRSRVTHSSRRDLQFSSAPFSFRRFSLLNAENPPHARRRRGCVRLFLPPLIVVAVHVWTSYLVRHGPFNLLSPRTLNAAPPRSRLPVCRNNNPLFQHFCAYLTYNTARGQE